MESAVAHEKGVVLVATLIVLALATLIGLSGMGSALVQERIAGNQKQIAEAFLAAERGVVSTIHAFTGQDFDGWGSEADTLAAIGGRGPHHLDGADGGFWMAEVAYPDPDDIHRAEITLTGQSGGAGTRRVLKLELQRRTGGSGAGDPEPDSAYTCVGQACLPDRVLPQGSQIHYDGRDWMPPSLNHCNAGVCVSPELHADKSALAGMHLIPAGEGESQQSGSSPHSAEESAQITGDPRILITSPETSAGDALASGWQAYADAALMTSERLVAMELGLASGAGSLALNEVMNADSPGLYHLSGSGSIDLSGDIHGAGVLIVSGGGTDINPHVVNFFPTGGSFTFEGLVILLDGAILDAGTGGTSRIDIYGAVVSLQGSHERQGGGLRGNVSIRYSSEALERLARHRLWDPSPPEFSWVWRETMGVGN
ncbi:pilus assembly PilX family protein [Ectothiorhodospira shaposhnikovii]|uniref:pilus assembly PilX family protein n=1 Tax=Ectothiorhodospira shaposhnikovii TaxID=1054 RepID=UPI001904669D|nr:pilus assembly PilX N-terminal domain-containing protein [Ectothiorhodospira shaposhnikovii]